MLRGVFERLFGRLAPLGRLPSLCAVCHAWPSQPVCESCIRLFGQPQPRCRTCARAVLRGMRQCGNCVVQPPPLDQCLAAVPYAYPWAGLIAEFKFHERTAWAAPFARLLRSTPWVEPALDAADCLLPMPLSRERLQERGFNQALLLAQALDAQRVQPDWLLRTRDTPPQRTLARKERQRSVRGAFAVDPLLAPQLRGRRVVLVDDVMTSGASLHAAAQVVRQAGAAHITGLVLARTE